MKNECPIVSYMPRVMTDANGLPIANVGNIDDDPNGRVLEIYVQFLQMDFDYLCLVWPKAKAKFHFMAQDIVDSLKPSVLFDASYEELILQGVKAFDEGDYIKSLHVLVPQVERMMRALLRTLGVPTISLERENAGLIERKTLGVCLNDLRVNEALEEKIILFYKALYNEKRGFNLRNEIAHGLAPVGVFCQPFATLVIQSIILLSGLRPEFCYIKNGDKQLLEENKQSVNVPL